MTNELALSPVKLSINEITIKESADKMIVTSKSISVLSQYDMENAATAARAMKALAKKIEDIRVSRVDPLNKQVKEINALLKGGMIDPLKEAASALEGKMLDYTKEQQRIAAEERRCREEEDKERRFAEMILAEDAGEDDAIEIDMPAAEVVAIAVPDITRSLSGAVASIRKRWTFEVLDVQDVAGAYPEMVMVNSSIVNEAIRNGLRIVPGLRIYEEEKMGVR